MKINHFVIVFFIVILFAACTEFFTARTRVGSDLNKEGLISKSSLQYNFKLTKKMKTFKDLFEYIYFDGDTFCFSHKFNKKTTDLSAKAKIKNNKTGQTYKVKTVLVNKNIIYGYTLIGSMLENFNQTELEKKISIIDSNLFLDVTVLIEIYNSGSVQRIEVPALIEVKLKK